MNFSRGRWKNPKFTLVQGRLPGFVRTRPGPWRGAILFFIWRPTRDVRFGLDHPGKDFQQNAQASFNVLEAMRVNGIKRIAFSSTGSVYGEAEIIPTPETAPFPVQTSLYAASKLAAEGFIHAYCEGYGFEGYIFRFVSILGERYTHGHVLDFYKQLRATPEKLKNPRRWHATQIVPLHRRLP